MRNNIAIGDTVEVIDESIEGVVKEVNGNVVFFEDKNGFLLSFDKNRLVKIKEKYEVLERFISNDILNRVIKEKEGEKKKIIPLKKKRKDVPYIELDLHAEKLIKNLKGLSNFEILTKQLDTAKGHLHFAKMKNIKRVIFIHGVGNGVLKMELQTMLNRYDFLKFYEANPSVYGNGATEVYLEEQFFV